MIVRNLRRYLILITCLFILSAGANIYAQSIKQQDFGTRYAMHPTISKEEKELLETLKPELQDTNTICITGERPYDVGCITDILEELGFDIIDNFGEKCEAIIKIDLMFEPAAVKYFDKYGNEQQRYSSSKITGWFEFEFKDDRLYCEFYAYHYIPNAKIGAGQYQLPRDAPEIPRDRYCAPVLKLLGAIGRTDSVLYALKSDRSTLGSEAAKLLIELKDKNTVEPLLKIAQSSTDNRAADEAIFALGGIGDERAVEPLIDILLDSTKINYVRESSAWALGRLKDERAIAPFVEILLSKNVDRRLRVHVMDGLSNFNNEKTIMALEEIANSKELDDGLKDHARDLLAKIRNTKK